MMISRRNFLAVAGAAAAAAALTACGGSSASSTSTASSAAASAASGAAPRLQKIAKVALTCDTGTIDDESFNQACWSAVSSYMGDDCQYYIPEADASDEDRETMIRQAVNDGADVIVCVGYLYGASLAWAAEQYPDVKFIAIDVTQGDIGTDASPQTATASPSRRSRQAIWQVTPLPRTARPSWASWAAWLFPLSSVTATALCRALMLLLRSWARTSTSTTSTAASSTAMPTSPPVWRAGTPTALSRLACGGGIYTSAVEAALKNNGYVIGVDVDQNYIGANGVADGTYAYNPFITSAMKGLSEAVSTALADIEAGEWSTIAATNGNFGLEDGDYIGLPTDEDSWNFETFTMDEYEDLKSKIASGEIVVDNSSDDATKPTVSEFTNVNYIQ